MSPVLGDRVRLYSGAWTGLGTVADGALVPNGAHGKTLCSAVNWDDAAPDELRGWIPNEMLEVVT